MIPNAKADVLIVGGGLSGGLLALLLARVRPELDVRVVEQGSVVGGNHTWSFFATDLTPEQQLWIDPLVAYRWDGYDVRFPDLKRTLSTGYRSIPSERLAAAVETALGPRLMTRTAVQSLDVDGVTLGSGVRLHGGAVIDARGARSSPHMLIAFQKFLGLEVETEGPHGLTRPIIMDATVPQADGYRFVYTLPFAADRLLIEDTYFSDDLALSREALRAQIDDYAAVQGWRLRRVIREEDGILPMVLAGDLNGLLRDLDEGAPKIGLGAALFNPATGYSLPDAVRLAERLGRVPTLTTETARTEIKAYLAEQWRNLSFQRLLNRMLFRAGRKDRRHRVLERFYGLSQGTVERLYRGQLTLFDRARILTGKPPVPIHEALRCLSEQKMLAQEMASRSTPTSDTRHP